MQFFKKLIHIKKKFPPIHALTLLKLFGTISKGTEGSVKFFGRRKNIMDTFIVWHKKNIKWWKKKLNVSDYGVAWIAFIKGLIIGLLIYHFFLN